VKVTKTSIYTNRKNTMEINITEDDYSRWKEGHDISDLLTYDEIEFLKTGATPAEMDDMDDNPSQTSDPYNGPQGWEWE